MRFFRMLREHLHISTKDSDLRENRWCWSLLCLSIFLFKTDLARES